jgi:hypothetical protein
MDQATVEGRANNAALMDGHGVISGDHAREISRRPDARIAPLGGKLAKDVLDQPSSVPDSAAEDLHTPRAKELGPQELLDEIKRLVKAKEDAKHPPTEEPNADNEQQQPEEEVDRTHPANDAYAPQDVPSDNSSDAEESGSTDTDTDTDTDMGTGTGKHPGAGEATNPADARIEHPRSESAEPEEPPCARPTRAERHRRSKRKTQTALPKSQPANAYRLSAALNRFVRIRDAYCTFPGCRRPAWKSEVDHTDEYDHDNPAAGGQTSTEDTKCLCKFHHLLKTFGSWIDFQDTDADGRTRIVFISPEGVRFHGPAWSGEDLFPALRDMTWRGPEPPRGAPPDMPSRRRTRLADKYARRRAERNRNRRPLETPCPPPTPPAPATDHDGPPPPF